MATPLYSKQMSIVMDASLIGDASVMGCATDFSLSVDKDMIEIACLSSTGAKQQVPDLYGWNISFSGLVMQEATVDEGKSSFYDLMANILGDDVSIGVYIVPDVTGNSYYGGTGYLSSMSMDGGVGSAMTFSGEIAGTGALEDLTVA